MLMKGQKTKLMKKLEGLKKREQTSIPLNDDPMEQEIPFADDKFGIEDRDDKTEVSGGKKSNTQFDAASVANAPLPFASSSDEGTAVISQVKSSKHTRIVQRGNEESTHVEITAGRDNHDKERISYGDVYRLETPSEEPAGGMLNHMEHCLIISIRGPLV